MPAERLLSVFTVVLVESSPEHYALSQRQDGQHVVQSQGIWWRRVRPGFYRPILPFLPLAEPAAAPCLEARMGGYQHAVTAQSATNSRLGFLLFREAQAYRLGDLRRSRRWEVNNASKRFALRTFADPVEFTNRAHPIYGEFYQRTQYQFRAERLRRDHFHRWSEQLFADPGCNLWGAFAGPDLAAVGAMRLIGRTLLYTSFFASAQGLAGHVSSFMLHSLRSAAAAHGGVDQILIGSPKLDSASRSVDAFYMSSGCELVWLPARLVLSPPVRTGLALAGRGILAQLRGEYSESPEPPASAGGSV